MHLRVVEPHEFGEIDTLVQTAFLSAPVSDGLEHDLVRRLRSSPGYLPDLELVVAKDAQLIGHVLATKVTIDGDHGRLEALEIAPLSVALEHRGRGIGARLVEDVLRRGRVAGYPAVFLVGDLRYYRRFGFLPVAELGVRNGNTALGDVTLGVELWPGALDGVGGAVSLI